MTNEQINTAIETVLHRNEHWIISRDYCNDLNAMHEAEKVLVNVTLQIAYTDILYDIECGNQERTGRWMPYSIPARQRAEAFLKTLDKWEEAK